ncbi:DUF4288 domain-containing protein [Bacillus zanthoxyli]|nr:DUF4288 domain-containing protein [Bacillus zanthoxyli]
MKINKSEKSDLEWYGVKVLYKNLVIGEPNVERLDENYEDHQIFEESILLIKARSFEQAYEIAENEPLVHKDSFLFHFSLLYIILYSVNESTFYSLFK